MKTQALTGLLMAVFALAGTAQATQIVVDYIGLTASGTVERQVLNGNLTGDTVPPGERTDFYRLSAGQMELNILSGALTNFDFSPVGDKVLAYCVEPQESVGDGPFDVTNLANAPSNHPAQLGPGGTGMGADNANDLRELIGNLPFDPFADEDVRNGQIDAWRRLVQAAPDAPVTPEPLIPVVPEDLP